MRLAHWLQKLSMATEYLPFLQRDIVEGVRANNKEAGDIIDRAAKIEGILDQVCDTLRQLEKLSIITLVRMKILWPTLVGRLCMTNLDKESFI